MVMEENLSFKELLLIYMDRKNIKQSKIAEILGLKKQTVYMKFKSDNFTEKDMKNYAEAIGMKLVIKLEEK